MQSIQREESIGTVAICWALYNAVSAECLVERLERAFDIIFLAGWSGSI